MDGTVGALLDGTITECPEGSTDAELELGGVSDIVVFFVRSKIAAYYARKCHSVRLFQSRRNHRASIRWHVR